MQYIHLPRLELDDGVVVELERDEGGQPAEGALAHLGQVVVAEGAILI